MTAIHAQAAPLVVGADRPTNTAVVPCRSEAFGRRPHWPFGEPRCYFAVKHLRAGPSWRRPRCDVPSPRRPACLVRRLGKAALGTTTAVLQPAVAMQHCPSPQPLLRGWAFAWSGGSAPAPNTFADAVDQGPSVVVAVPAEGLDGGRAGAGPLRHGAAGRAPGGVPIHVRPPVPARAAPLGPALGVVLPRLAAAVGR